MYPIGEGSDVERCALSVDTLASIVGTGAAELQPLARITPNRAAHNAAV